MGISIEPRILFLALFLGLIVIHELIHGITCAVFVKDHFRAIEFGFMDILMPYCTCSQPMKKFQCILGFIMPALILGFGLAAVSISVDSYFLFFLAELNLAASGGDFLAVLKMLLHPSQGQDTVYCVHPYKIGAVMFEK